MKKPGNPMRQYMLAAGCDVVCIAKYLHDMKAGGTEYRVLFERLSEIGFGVINKAAFVDALSFPDVAEAEFNQETSKAKQQSILRLQPIIEAIEETSEDSSDSLQSAEVEQLMASHEEELIRLRSELEASFAQVLAKNVKELTVELESVRAEAGQHRRTAVKVSDHAAQKADTMATTNSSQSKQVEQQSILRLQPIIEAIKQTSEDSSNSLQSEEVEQLKVSHKEELIRLRSELDMKVEELTAELDRVRAEAEEERKSAVKAISDQSKDPREIKAAALKNTKERFTIDTDAFVGLIHVIDNSEDKLVAATNLPIIRLMQILVDLSFKKHEDLHQNLQHVAFHFFSVLGLLPRLNKVFGAFIRAKATKEATEMESAVELSSGVGSILSYCEKKSSEAEVDQDQSLVLPERVFAIKEAIYRTEYGNNDDEIKETVYRSRHEDDDTTGVSRDVINNEVTEEDFRCFINDAVNDSNVRKHLSMGNQTNNLMTHVSNLINSAKDFAQRANPEVLFDEDMTATEYLFTYVSPALASGDDELLKEAWRVACSVFVSLNKIVSVGPTANADTKANDPRKKQIITMLREVECRTINGEVDETADVYWSGIGKIYNDRRLRAIRTFACLFLRTPVQRSLPPGFFAEFGFTRSFLRLPASLIGKWSTFITPNFLSDCSHTMPAKYRKKFDDIITKEVQASEDTGERTIFIQGNEQRNSLKLLLDAHDALVSGSRIEV
eukprot:scaffold18742_cov70-Skeletonema_marinoi.AAC.3